MTYLADIPRANTIVVHPGETPELVMLRRCREILGDLLSDHPALDHEGEITWFEYELNVFLAERA